MSQCSSQSDIDPHRRKRRFWALAALIAAALVSGALLLFWNDPARSGIFPPCPFHFLTGLYCPGCGSLRAMHAILHGDVLTALRFNPLLLIAIPLVALLLIKPAIGRNPWVPRIVLVVFVAYWVLRNIPIWPLTCLAPG